MATYYIVEKDREGHERKVLSAETKCGARSLLHDLERYYDEKNITGIHLYIKKEE